MKKLEAEYQMYRHAARIVEDDDVLDDYQDASEADKKRILNARAAVVLHLRACAYRIKERMDADAFKGDKQK